ncbi:MAG: phosphomannose isomerase type II C-terminal cupin domain [Synechococcaceae cyanobacterium]|nr:phosphomannose isomerase type II C-terminal cupin domain [Synechococcaceae cyanobacterium]
METTGSLSVPATSGSTTLERHSQRPWGWFETLASGEGYLVKRLCIASGRRISLQRHRHRSEHWVVVGGSGALELEGQTIPASPGTTLHVPQGAWHRAAAGPEDLLIVEVQRGALLREEDIERCADDFGRAA